MSRFAIEQDCHCSCDSARFRVHGQPLLRAICHCTICQAFNEAPFADIALFRARDVDPPAEGKVSFDTYRPPPNVQRGKCVSCGKPAIENLQLPLLPAMVIVPTTNFTDQAALPPPAMHVFYNRRVADVDDDLPKYSGYWRSQMVFTAKVLGQLIRG